MTYCVGILLDEGLCSPPNSRTNAGIDRVSTFRKMFTFEKPGERFFALLTAGNLSSDPRRDEPAQRVARHRGPGDATYAPWARCSARRESSARRMREVHKIDGGYLQQRDVDFSGSFILAGQLKGGQLRLFLIYDAGNFIEAMGDTIYFQIGEVKYGKPILDRIIQREHEPERRRQMRADLLRFDHALQRLGRTADRHLLIYRRGSMAQGLHHPAGGTILICSAIRDGWGGAITRPSTTSARSRLDFLSCKIPRR